MNITIDHSAFDTIPTMRNVSLSSKRSATLFQRPFQRSRTKNMILSKNLNKEKEIAKTKKKI